MIGKVCKRGSDARRLLGYLFREGLAGEHGLTAPHTAARLIACWEAPPGLSRRSLRQRDSADPIGEQAVGEAGHLAPSRSHSPAEVGCIVPCTTCSRSARTASRSTSSRSLRVKASTVRSAS